MDFRTCIVARYAKRELTYAQVAELFNVGEASASRLLTTERERGTLGPDSIGGGYPPRSGDEQFPLLTKRVAEKPDRTRADLGKAWTKRHGTNRSISSIRRSLTRAGLTRKKVLHGQRAERIDVQQKREAFFREFWLIGSDRLVSFDDSACNIAMATEYGRAPSGVRVAETKPWNWEHKFTVVGAIKNDSGFSKHEDATRRCGDGLLVRNATRAKDPQRSGELLVGTLPFNRKKQAVHFRQRNRQRAKPRRFFERKLRSSAYRHFFVRDNEARKVWRRCESFEVLPDANDNHP